MTRKLVLIAALERMSQRERKHAFACMNHYEKEWKRVARLVDGPSAAHSIHGGIDDRMKHMLATSPHAKNVKCAKGCDGCCRLNVDITAKEAELLVLWMRDQGIEVDQQRLERQAGKTPDTWAELTPEDKRCVFLGEDGACRVYEHRPGACRKYFVVTDPEFCDQDLHPGHDVGILFDVEGELMHAAALKAHGVGGMAHMLRKALKKKER